MISAPQEGTYSAGSPFSSAASPWCSRSASIACAYASAPSRDSSEISGAVRGERRLQPGMVATPRGGTGRSTRPNRQGLPPQRHAQCNASPSGGSVPTPQYFRFPAARQAMARYRSHLRVRPMWVSRVCARCLRLPAPRNPVDKWWIASLAHRRLRTGCAQAVDNSQAAGTLPSCPQLVPRSAGSFHKCFNVIFSFIIK